MTRSQALWRLLLLLWAILAVIGAFDLARAGEPLTGQPGCTVESEGVVCETWPARVGEHYRVEPVLGFIQPSPIPHQLRERDKVSQAFFLWPKEYYSGDACAFEAMALTYERGELGSQEYDCVVARSWAGEPAPQVLVMTMGGRTTVHLNVPNCETVARLVLAQTQYDDASAECTGQGE